MAADFGPALVLDFLKQPVNVQWTSGLAVEFGNKAEDAPKPPTPSPTLNKKP
jgi:hypothetical protein